MSMLRSTIALTSERADAHPRHRLTIVTQASFTRRDEHISQAIGVSRLHLKYAGVIGTGCEIGALYQLDAFGEPGFMGRGEYRIKIVLPRFLEPGLDDRRRTLGNMR